MLTGSKPIAWIREARFMSPDSPDTPLKAGCGDRSALSLWPVAGLLLDA